jgi:hypothetical protein
MRAATSSASSVLPRLAWPATIAFQETTVRCGIPSNSLRAAAVSPLLRRAVSRMFCAAMDASSWGCVDECRGESLLAWVAGGLGFQRAKGLDLESMQ